MKKSKFSHSITILLICLAIGGSIAGAALAQSGAKVTLTPQKLALAPGDTGMLEIRIADVAQLAGAEVHLTYDPALLEIADADPEMEGVQINHGDLLSPDFVVQNVSDKSGGTIDYAIVCMPVDKAVSGSGVLARINFAVRAEGEAEIAIRSVLLSNMQGQPIEVEIGPGAIVTSHAGSPVTVWIVIGAIALIIAAGFAVVVWRAIRAH